MIEQFNQRLNGVDIDYIGGIDARGFIIGAALAFTRGIGFVPVRKKGKLPFDTIAEDYALEYGTATLSYTLMQSVLARSVNRRRPHCNRWNGDCGC